MSLNLTAVLALLLALTLSSTAVNALQSKQIKTEDPTWNYDDNGRDWTEGDCPSTSQTQSPINLESTFTNWADICDLSFLTAWDVASVDESHHSVTNYTYVIEADDGNFGMFYGVEPLNFPCAQIQWGVTQIRLHYPSEHTIDGVQYDLEMQVMLNDTTMRGDNCHKGGLSLLFSIGETQSDFWDFVGKDSYDLDLNQVFSKTAWMSTQMYGYQGSETIPDCTTSVCWYIPSSAGTITSDTLDQIKQIVGVDFNNRATDLGQPNPDNPYIATGLLYTEPSVAAAASTEL